MRVKSEINRKRWETWEAWDPMCKDAKICKVE